MNNKPNNSTKQTRELGKPMSVFIYCVLIFVIVFTSCSVWFVSNNPNYMYALKAQKIFYRNEDSFKKVVDYIISLDLPTIDSINSVSLTLYPNGSSNIDSDIDQETIEALKATECLSVVYYHNKSASFENSSGEHLIQFKYFYSKGEYPIIEYSSNGLTFPGTVYEDGRFYEVICEELDDNWGLYYQGKKECKT